MPPPQVLLVSPRALANVAHTRNALADVCSAAGDREAACEQFGCALALVGKALGPGVRDLSDLLSEATIALLLLCGSLDAAARFQRALLHLRLLRLKHVCGGRVRR